MQVGMLAYNLGGFVAGFLLAFWHCWQLTLVILSMCPPPPAPPSHEVATEVRSRWCRERVVFHCQTTLSFPLLESQTLNSEHQPPPTRDLDTVDGALCFERTHTRVAEPPTPLPQLPTDRENWRVARDGSGAMHLGVGSLF